MVVDETLTVDVEPGLMQTPIRHSTRRRPWYVHPVSDVLDTCGQSPKVLCGSLFNAEAERVALGQTKGEGEECCIAMEPIAEADLAFAPGLRVQQLYPEFTGVELLCGHRFSAVCLLWHWCLSPMVCPICRAHFSLGAKEPVQCMHENFPIGARKALSIRIRLIKAQEVAEQELASTEYIMEGMLHEAMGNIVQQTIQDILNDPRSFHVILSIQNGVHADVVRCLQLHRAPDTLSGLMQSMRFNVQYSHLRRFSSISTTAPSDGVDVGQPHNLMASLVMQDPMNPDRMVEISRLDHIDITPGLNLTLSTSECTDVHGQMRVEFCQHTTTGVVSRILSLSFNVNTVSVLEAVTRLFTYEISYAEHEHGDGDIGMLN